MHIPLRTYHCSLCNACISIPDHRKEYKKLCREYNVTLNLFLIFSLFSDCYFLGRCVGRANQRFFICFAFYASIGSLIGVSSILQVMTYYRDYQTIELFYYLLPVTVAAYFSGYGSIQPFEMLYVGLIDFGLGTFLFCSFLVLLGLKSAFSGM